MVRVTGSRTIVVMENKLVAAVGVAERTLEVWVCVSVMFLERVELADTLSVWWHIFCSEAR